MEVGDLGGAILLTHISDGGGSDQSEDCEDLF